MSDNRQWDSINLQSLNLPYNKALRELDPTPRIVNGTNTFVTYGGKIMKRPGTTSITNTSLSSLRIDRLWLYETLDSPVIVYMVASVFNGTSWALYYNRLDGASPGWVNAGSLRQLNASTRPHEATVSRGILYVKGYPSVASGETLGTVIFNGTGGTPFTTFWGVVGPTIPARISGGVPRLNANITATATSFNLAAQNNYNLATYSQDFTQLSTWTNNAFVLSSGNLAPDGTNTATLLTQQTTTAFLIQTVPVVNGSTYTYSVWLKSAANLTVPIQIQVPTATTINCSVTNQWQRFSMSATAASGSFVIVVGSGSAWGTGTSALQAWGAQLELANNQAVTGFTPDFTQSTWVKNSLTLTSTNNADPNGINDAALFTQTTNTSFVYQAFPTVAGTYYTFSVWLKSTGALTVPMFMFNGVLGANITLGPSASVTTAWQQFTITGLAISSQSSVAIGSGGAWGTGTSTFQAWAPQITATTPQPYERTLGPYNLPAVPFNVLIDYELITVLAFTAGAVTSCLRGAQGTVPAAHNANAAVVYRDWIASTHPTTVNNFWAYSYAYQTRSGHLSNRSPLETNPDNNPSLTGPVINQVPKLQLYGHPDTVNVPNLVIFRSTDGGGTYAQIATVTNTGFNPISWQDQYNQASFAPGSLVVTTFGIGGNNNAASITSPYTIIGNQIGVIGTSFGNAAAITNAAATIPTSPTWTASVANTALTSAIASFKAAPGGTGVTQVATTVTANGASAATTAAINTTGATLLVITMTIGVAIGGAAVSDNQGNTWHALQNSPGSSGSNSGIWYAFDKAGAPLVTNASHTVTVTTTTPGITFSAFTGTLPNHVDPYDSAAGQSVNSSGSNNLLTISPGAINANIGAIDPTPDSALNFQFISPTLTSNSPPPTVISKSTTIATLTVALTGVNNGSNTIATFSTTYNSTALSALAPAVPFTITIDNELLTVTALNINAGTATVNRTVNGTIFANHAIGANVIVTPVVGLDAPIASTPIASYASRLWMGIGNILFYSAQEELNLGVPEEAWPSGTFGNFYRLQFPITNIIDTTNALYVITTEAVYQLTGSNLETFFLQPILHNIGGAIGHPQAVTKYENSVIWLTNDLRVGLLQGGTFRTLSEPLATDIVNTIINNGAVMGLKYWAAYDKEWIVLSSFCTAVTNNQTWVYDIMKSEQTNQDFWSTPWSIQSTAVASGRMREIEQNRRLVFATYDGTNTINTRITENPSEFVGYDALPSVAQQSYNFKLQTNLWLVPPGDHVNLLRRPGLIPIVYGLVLEETVFSTPSTDPQVFYYTNDLWTTPKSAAAAEYTVHDDQPIGYRTRIFPLQEKARRFAFEVDKLQTTELFEIQDFSIIYNADAGSGI